MNPAQPGRAKVRELSSATNSLLKVFRHALKRGITRDGWLAIEGPHLVEEALASGATVHSVLVDRAAQARFRTLLGHLPQDAEVATVPDRLFAQVAQTQTPQGIAALVEVAARGLASLLAAPDGLCVVACGLQNPGNFGTILRSAYALGATACVTLPETVSAFNPKAVRSSAGAVLRLPVLSSAEPGRFFQRLRAANFQIVAADRRGTTPISEIDWRRRTALLIGREGSGLDEATLCTADYRVAIPIRDGADSLNAATAASICLYEAARQRGFAYGTVNPGAGARGRKVENGK